MSFYLAVSAIFTLFVLAVAVASIPIGKPAILRGAIMSHPLEAGFQVLFSLGQLWCARALLTPNRTAGYVAVATLGAPLLLRLSGQSVQAINLIVAIVGIALVVSVWSERRYLSPN